MSSPVIQVQNIGKDYTISHDGFDASYRTLRESMASWFTKLSSRHQQHTSEVFSAVKDVSFEVNQGEVLGIIGRNGAGKSTLLKVLSRITEPTRGHVRLRGRVASLLEVGTGFHGELTGRENVFLNGAILGMTRAEIRKKFDEIVEFSGVEKFLDTPVKRYSSGMYVRLAFAVAAHLEPEILIVDEVLSVGDAEFQKRCLGKMESVAQSEGRTVLFVSHNLAAVSRLCRRIILMNKGSIEMDGPANQVVAHYSFDQESQKTEFVPGQDGNEAKPVRLISSKVITSRSSGQAHPGEAVEIQIHYRVQRKVANMRVGFRLICSDGTVVLTSSNADDATLAETTLNADTGEYLARCLIPPHWLNQGTYQLALASDVPNQDLHFFYDNALTLQVDAALDHRPTLVDGRYGLLAPLLSWNTQRINS